MLHQVLLLNLLRQPIPDPIEGWRLKRPGVFLQDDVIAERR